MFVKENENNNKINNSKNLSTHYFSPYTNKKLAIGDLYTEPRKILQTESIHKNKTKAKISNPIMTKNLLNIESKDLIKKSSKFHSQINDISYQQQKNTPQSYKKINSKLYLKKNIIPNLESLNETKYIGTSQLISYSKMNTESSNSRNSKIYKNKPLNIKYNIDRYPLHNFTSVKESSHNLKKTASSAADIFKDNNIKRAKTKPKNISCSNSINLKQIEYKINTDRNNNLKFLSPHSSFGPKIIFVKSNKNKINDKSQRNNINKTSFKGTKVQTNEKRNNNIENKNEIQYFLRNTYNNVKIYPTTFLNNKIIYQTKNYNNANIANFHKNSKSKSKIQLSKNKNQQFIHNKDKKTIYGNVASIEEVHFLYVNTIQNGKKIILEYDK